LSGSGTGRAAVGRHAAAGRRTKRCPCGWSRMGGTTWEEEEASPEEEVPEEEAMRGGGTEASGRRSAERRMRRRRRGRGTRRLARREAPTGRAAAAGSARDEHREGGHRGMEGRRGGATWGWRDWAHSLHLIGDGPRPTPVVTTRSVVELLIQ
jgi:hypothetical protein